MPSATIRSEYDWDSPCFTIKWGVLYHEAPEQWMVGTVLENFSDEGVSGLLTESGARKVAERLNALPGFRVTAVSRIEALCVTKWA